MERPEDEVIWVSLDKENPDNFERMRVAFKTRNAGYDVTFHYQVLDLPPTSENRVCFIQNGGGTITINSDRTSKFSVGDIIMLQPMEAMTSDSLVDILAFSVPEDLPLSVPAFVRPDWDANITDTPGGCATETNAYRRILLTWLDKVGPYQFHAINAHRVRIMDSFTHYHPKDKGFDEFYLVQMVLPEARLITSSHVQLIEQPHAVEAEHVSTLLESSPLSVGDLVYMPRGTIHRGVGGVLAQVITVPGFIPGSEIGVDHHLRAINENLSLSGEDYLPFNRVAARTATIK